MLCRGHTSQKKLRTLEMGCKYFFRSARESSTLFAVSTFRQRDFQTSFLRGSMRHTDSRQNPARETKRKFRFTPTTFVLLTGAILLVAFLGIATWANKKFPVFVDSTDHAYIDLLQDFQTYTVEVEFEGAVTDDKVFGKTKDEWAEKSLVIVSESIRKNFPDVKVSRFGKPHSYSTNPLNVSITFFLSIKPVDANRVKVNAAVARAYFFHALKSAKGNDSIEKISSSRTFQKMTSQFENQTMRLGDTPFPRGASNEEEVKNLIKFYSEIIARSSNPNFESAADAEKKMLNYKDSAMTGDK